MTYLNKSSGRMVCNQYKANTVFQDTSDRLAGKRNSPLQPSFARRSSSIDSGLEMPAAQPVQGIVPKCRWLKPYQDRKLFLLAGVCFV